MNAEPTTTVVDIQYGAIPKTTAQLADGARRKISSKPELAGRANYGADVLIKELPERLPHLAPADIAAVLLHAATLTGTSVLLALDDERATVDRFTLLGPNILAVAGERMHASAVAPADGAQ
jgi:hypothetical protein